MIVVSHDRELLETVDAIAELIALGVTRYSGNWSHYRERRDIEIASAGTVWRWPKSAWPKSTNVPRRRSSGWRAR